MLPCICSVIDHRRRQNVVRTSKCGKNISDTLGYASCATILFLPNFDVICDLLLNRRIRRMATWRTRNAVGTRTAGEYFHSFFEFSQTFMSASITRQKNGEHVFYFVQKITPKKGKQLVNFSLLAPSLRQQRALVLCFYRVLSWMVLYNNPSYS